MLKILKYGFIGWVVLSILTFPLYWPFARMWWVFMPNVASPKFDPPASVAEARLQDIEYLTTLTKYDRSFSDQARTDFATTLDTLRETSETISDAAFYLGLAEAIALGDNGHTNLSYRPQYSEFNTIGARLYAFNDGVYVVSAASDKADTIGRRVEAIDGIPIKRLQASLQAYRGGNKTWRTLYSTLILESPDLLNAAGYAASPDKLDLTLISEEGLPEIVSFDGRDAENPDDLPWRSAWQTLVPDPEHPAYQGWAHAMDKDGATLPRYLTQPEQVLDYGLENGGYYIRALPGFKAGEQSIKGAYEAILSGIPDASLDYLVVDFRLHDGGDYTKSMAFSKAAPKKVKEDGAVYIITGPNTFSAAIVTTAMLKYYSGERGMIIGEQMGDREQFWAERGSSFRLPNSGYYVNYATGYHDWEKGCKGEPYCYTMNEMYEVPAGDLSPSVTLDQGFDSYQSGEDVVLEWIAEQTG
ncbi:MAG: hypothetical protein AAFQ24_07220 [Pseudomonadota bacterium]